MNIRPAGWLKVLIDMPVTSDAVSHLRAAGHDAIHAVDLGLARSPDSQVLDVARREERIVVTADPDYPRSARIPIGRSMH